MEGRKFQPKMNRKQFMTNNFLPEKGQDEEEKLKEMNFLENHIENQNGILYLAMHDLFEKINECKDRKFFIRCSYIEIYTDLVYDLL